MKTTSKDRCDFCDKQKSVKINATGNKVCRKCMGTPTERQKRK